MCGCCTAAYRSSQNRRLKRNATSICGWTYLDVCFVPFHKSVQMEEKCHKQFKLKWGLSACSWLFIWITLNPSDLNGFRIEIGTKMDGNATEQLVHHCHWMSLSITIEIVQICRCWNELNSCFHFPFDFVACLAARIPQRIMKNK